MRNKPVMGTQQKDVMKCAETEASMLLDVITDLNVLEVCNLFVKKVT